MLGHVEVKNSPPIMRDNEEAVENVEVQRRYGKEVHRSNGLTMVAQKCCPSLCRLRTPRCLPQPAQHASFGNIEAEHLQLAMNSWRTPGRVLGNHAENDLPQFPAHAFPSRTSPVSRNPRPIQLEPGSVPANHRLRLDEDQCPPPTSPEAPQANPEQFVKNGKPRLRMLLFENTKLMPQSQVFQEQLTARAKESRKENSKEPHQANHEASFTC